MADIYLCGHGEWKTKGHTSGFVVVPKDTTVTFYTPVGRFLGLLQTGLIMSRAQGSLPVDQKFVGFQNCTDVTLLPCPEFKPKFEEFATAAGVRIEMVSVATPLQDLLKKFAGNNLHWLACRARFAGKDTTEGGYNDDYFPAAGVGV